MQLDLIDLRPYNTRNRLWLSEIFGTTVRRFEGSLKAGTFPVFVVQGNVTINVEDRSINYKLFSHLDSINCCFGLINVEDENYDHDLSVYSLKNCLFIFREYYRPRGGVIQFSKDFVRSFCYPTHQTNSLSRFGLFTSDVKSRFVGKYGVLSFLLRQYLPFLAVADKVYNIPLGYTDRIGGLFHGGSEKTIYDNPVVDREYRWSFCGECNKSDRLQMLSSLRSSKPNYVYRSDETGKTDMLSGETYLNIMLQSVFIPCPFGNINIDTYRLFEALETGAIPVLTNGYAFQPYDYYTLLLGPHPIPTFSSWTDACKFIENADRETICTTSIKIRKWYETFKNTLKNSMMDFIDKSISGNMLKSDINQLNPVAVPK